MWNFCNIAERRVTSNETDILSKVIQFLVYAFAFYPVMLLGVVIYNLDPLYHLANLIYPKELFRPSSVNMIFLFLRLVIWIITVYRTCRLFPITFILGTVYQRLCNHCLDMIHTKTHLLESFKLYQQLAVTMSLGVEFIQCLCSTLLASGFVFSICFNYASLRMYSVLPTLIYPYFPSVACFLPLLIDVNVTGAIKINTASTEVVKNHWKLEVLSRKVEINRRYLLRKIWSFRPLRMTFGGLGYDLFVLSRFTKIQFYGAISMYTVDALVSMPE